MKNNRILVLLCLATLLTAVIFGISVFAVTENPGTDEIPYVEHSTSIAAETYDSEYTVYSAEAAAAAGVPEGYSGYVIKVKGKTDSAYGGLCMDFSEQNIDVDDIESISMRIYLPSGNKEMRMLVGGSTSWIMRQVPSVFDAWCDISLYSDGTGFSSGNMSSLANDAGNLGAFCLIGRFSGSNAFYYIDSVNITYKSGATADKTPPVISYSGANYISATEGSFLTLDGISAYDEYDCATAQITYEWSSGAVDSYGALKYGMHTCTVKATDRSGNVATLVITVNVTEDTSKIVIDGAPFTDFISGVSAYGGNAVMLTADEAVAANVPAGYSGGVLKVSGSVDRFGMTFDPTSYKIPTELIEKITFRFYFPTTGTSLRFSDTGAISWLVLTDPAVGSWVEYTLGADGSGFTSDLNKKINDLADEDGLLKIFGIGVKCSAERVFYIDSVTVKLKENDGEAPVMDYDGECDILTSAEKKFVIPLTVYDEQEKRSITPLYTWSDGAVDEDGLLQKGTHTCVVSASDFYGNTSSLNLNVTVEDKDIEAPEILFYPDDIYAMAGTYARLVIRAEDNYDRVTVTLEWSEGAVDGGGMLLAGEHTLTLSVTDYTGNVSQKVINVHVLEDDYIVGDLIVCE